MEIGTKIKVLREERNLSQVSLAKALEISQTALHYIETGQSKKVDVLLLDKICKVFDKELSYFMEDKIVNKVKINKGQISCENFTINNFPESILEDVKKLIEDNKSLRQEVAELNKKLNNN